MNSLITSKQNEINQLCEEYGVKNLYAFGSVVREDFKFYSDVDLLVEFKDEENNNVLGEHYFWLREEFAYLFKRPVDLLIDKHIKESFQEFVNKERVVVYG